MVSWILVLVIHLHLTVNSWIYQPKWDQCCKFKIKWIKLKIKQWKFELEQKRPNNWNQNPIVLLAIGVVCCCSLFWDLNFRLDQGGRKHPDWKRGACTLTEYPVIRIMRAWVAMALKTGKTGVILITIDFEWNFNRPLPDPNDQKWFRKIFQIRSINCILHRRMIICKIGAQPWRHRSTSSPTDSWWNAKNIWWKVEKIVGHSCCLQLCFDQSPAVFTWLLHK